MLIRDEYVFKMTGLAVHVCIGIACTVFLMSMTATDDMCSTITLAVEQNKTLYYSPSTTEPKTCCCNLSSNHTDMPFSISSNATCFQLVFHNSGTLEVPQKEIGLKLSKFRLCANTTSNSTEAGAVTIKGTETFSVMCRTNTPFLTATTVHQPLSTATERNVQSRTPPVAPRTAPTSVETTTRDITVTTSTLLPPARTNTQNESTTSTAGVSQNEKSDDDTVIWIIIPSVAGTLLIIIGVVVYCVVSRKQSRATARDDGYGREGNDTLMADNILYSRGHTIYSLARGVEPVNKVADSHDPGNDLVMSENCLYNHHEKQGIHGNVHEGQGHDQTAGKQDRSGEASTHREKPDFSHLYAKVDKTSSQSK